MTLEYNKNNPDTIQVMFNSIAKQYDKTNAVLSFQLHRLWNRKLIHEVIGNASPSNFLDLCCGTGEIAFGSLKKCPYPCKAFLIDFCEEMLSCARAKAKNLNLERHDISYIQADAQQIPLPNASIKFATIAYGIRNIKDPKKCLNEVFRVLKPGGKLGILELTQPKNPFLKFGHQVYLKNILPLMGKLLTSNQNAYQYLCNSIHTFIKPEDLQKILNESGFHTTYRHSLTGGIATILIGEKSKLEE